MDNTKRKFFPQLSSLATKGKLIAKKWLEQAKISSSRIADMISMQWKAHTSNNLLGLDISTDSVKLLKIDLMGNQYRVENFSMAPLPANTIVKDEVKDPFAIINAIKDMIRQAEPDTKNVAVAVPRSSTIMKTITINNRLTPQEIESRAWLEANRLFPDLVGNIYLDFAITGPAAQDPDQLEVLLVACRKEHIDPYVEILKQAGLTPRVFDVNCYALERAIPLVIPSPTQLKTIAVLNLNFTLSSFIVKHEGNLVHAHDQSYDGRHLIAQIEAREEVKEQATEKVEAVATAETSAPANETPAQAVAAPVTASETPMSHPRSVTDVLRESLSSHLRHTIHFFYTSKPNITIQKLILSGDCANIPELPAFIQQEVGIETVIADPFADMLLAPGVRQESLKVHAPALMLCCGLALSKVEKVN